MATRRSVVDVGRLSREQCERFLAEYNDPNATLTNPITGAQLRNRTAERAIAIRDACQQLLNDQAVPERTTTRQTVVVDQLTQAHCEALRRSLREARRNGQNTFTNPITGNPIQINGRQGRLLITQCNTRFPLSRSSSASPRANAQNNIPSQPASPFSSSSPHWTEPYSRWSHRGAMLGEKG